MGIAQKDFLEFDILEVARRCGIPIIKQLPDGQWLARCPFCGDSRRENHGHLTLDPRTGRYHCKKCWEGGYAVGLYARIRGTDTKTAYKELAVASGQIPEIQYDPRRVVQVAPEEPMAGIDRRHEVYAALLDLLKLTPRHHADLLRRGLPESIIIRNQYRSSPDDAERRWAVCERLIRAIGEPGGIPGFYKNKAGKWDLVAPPGYFVPVRDGHGRIQGLQVRLDAPKDGAKYIWLSSRGRPEGCGARTWVHVAEPVGQAPTDRIWVTEGPLKGDVAAMYLGVRFLAVPGAAVWRDVAVIVRELGARQVVLAYDADLRENPVVARAAGDLAADLKANRLKVVPASWPPEIGKGVDDACVTLTREHKEVTEAVFVSGFKVTRTRTVTESVKIEGAPPSFLQRLGRLLWGNQCDVKSRN